jgi:Immunity protein 50
MSEIASLIAGSEKLTSIFGQWPSFHDADVHELHFQRGHIDEDVEVYEFPHLTVKSISG